MNAQEFGLPLDKLRDFMLRDAPRSRGPVYEASAPGMTEFGDPLPGVVYGERLAAAGPQLDPGSGAGLALARSAVPHGVEPEAVVCGDPAQALAAVEASGGRGAVFVALLDGRAALTLGAPDADPDTVALQPGDGVAFPAETRECRLRWLEGGRGKALVGR